MTFTSALLLILGYLACNALAIGLMAINPREPDGRRESGDRGPLQGGPAARPVTVLTFAARPASHAGVAAGPLSGRASPASAASPH